MSNTTEHPILSLRNVSKTFVTSDVEVSALKNITLSINEGEYVSISGPSGCGKSTLLAILGLLDGPSQGEYQILGVDTHTLNADQQAEIRNLHIGFVFQSFNLIDDLSVFDNVALPLTYRQDALGTEEIKSRVLKALEHVEMAHRQSHRPNQLSGGQQQRVAIARALAGAPSILLVDEPTGNLDSKNGDAVMAILDKLNKNGVTICMVTHDPRYAGHAARRVNLLDGTIAGEMNASDAGILATGKQPENVTEAV